MRRNIRRRPEKENWWENKKIITSGAIVATAFAFVVGVSLYSNETNDTTKQNKANSNQIISLMPEENDATTNTQSASTSIGNSIKESNNTDAKNSANEISENTTTSTANTTNSTKSNTAKVETKADANNTNTTDIITKKQNEVTPTSSIATETKKELTFAWPVQGEILKAFSTDNLLYSSTLQEWVVHNGIDIKADKTSVVTAAADGTVKSIKNDPRYGLTVIIEHDGEYKTVYSNLLTAEFVVEGEKVTQGQTIGTVGNTATFESADEPHLHFEILKNDEYVDPTIYLK